MMPGYLCIDVETSGLPDRTLPADDPRQPYLAVFCAIPVDNDLVLDGPTINIPIKPDGWEMSPEATAKNGLTTEMLLQEGRPPDEAVDFYINAIREGRVVLAYGAWFDCKIMRGAMRRAGKPDLIADTQAICIMKALGGRWQKLQVVCERMGVPLSNPHRALDDTNACLAIARQLKFSGRWPYPYTFEKRID